MSSHIRGRSSPAAGQQVADGLGIVDHEHKGNAGTSEEDE